LVWTGNTNANWDTTTKNWLDTNNTAVVFANGNGAIFDDTSVVTNVNLTTTLIPQTVTLSNNVNTYTLAGSGKLSGAASIALAGSGTLILNETAANNDFSGGITINSGTLQVGTNGAGGSVGSGGITDNGALVFNRTGSLLVGGAISGTGTVTKQGAGTVILSGANNYIGTTTISGGTLQIGNGGGTGALGTGDVTDDATLTFNLANSLTVAANISGAGGISQNGTGATTLSGTETYTGPTVINAGTLLVDTTLSATSLVTNDVAGTLGGSGTISAPIRSRGQISPGPINAAGTLTVTDVTLDSGATLKFDLGNNPSGVNDLLTVGGNLNLNNNVIKPNFIDVPLTNSPYVVLNYTGTKTGNFNSTASGTHYAVTVDQSVANQVSLLVSGSGANLKWNSTNSSAWDLGVSSNWLNGASQDVFYGGDNVRFDDSVANVITNIVLSGDVAPSSITNNSSTYNYIINGPGRIRGSTPFVKQGSSKLTMAGTVGSLHDFTGPLIISGGIVTVGTITLVGPLGGPTGNGEITLDGGTLQCTAIGGFNINRGFTVTANGGGLDFSPGGSANSGMTMSGAITLPDNGPRTLTLGGTDPAPLQSGSGQPLVALGDSPDSQPTKLVKIGNNVWRLTASDSYSGGTFIKAGRLTGANAGSYGTGLVTVTNSGQALLTAAAAFANNFSISGIGIASQPTGEALDNFGAIFLGANGVSISGAVTLDADARITARGATTTGGAIDGQISGNFNLELGHGGGTGLTGSGDGIITLSNPTNNWSGNTIISHGVVKAGGTGEVIPNGAGKGNVVLNGSGALSGGNVGSVLDLNGLTETINGLVSSNNAALCSVINNGGAPAALTVGDNNATATFGGAIQDGTATTALTKIGTGKETLIGTNTYTGSTTISNGVLALTGSGSIASSLNITIAGGATLDVSGLSPAFALGSGQTLSNSTSTAMLNGNAGTGSGAVSLTYASGTPSLVVTNGTLTLNSGTVFTVNNTGPALAAASYKIISKATAGNVGLVAGTLSSVTVGGGGLASGTTPSLQINSGELFLVVSGNSPSQPHFTGISLNGTTLTLMATNGTISGQYVLLGTTNVAKPLSQWTPILTNNFDGSGNLNLSTNIINPANAQMYYILSQ
jgi:fibronectin-binding autotransporter adhesin